MGSKGGSAPKAPDPYKTAAAEAQFNRLDSYSPSGSGVRYGYTDPATGQFVQGLAPHGAQSAVQQQESPTEKALREALEPASVALTNRVIADNVIGMPGAARVGDRGTVAKSIFDRSFSLMKPAMDQQQERLITNLQARGLPVGGEAFNEAYGAQQREVQDTIARLAMDADTAAGQEQSRQFGLDAAQRQNSIAELVAAMGGGYNPPNAVPNNGATGVNYSGLVGEKYRADMDRYNQQQANKSATAGAIGSLGGALLMKSDRRLKRNIRAVGRKGALTVYEYRYFWDRKTTRRRGYMAHEVMKVMPQAVHKVGDFLLVDYALLPEVA